MTLLFPSSGHSPRTLQIARFCWRSACFAGSASLNWGPTALAVVLVALTCAKAIMAIDVVWDSLAYHLPFAALRVGILSPWQYQRPPGALLTGFYNGFPVLGDWLQGILWKLTGWPEAANLLAIILLSALVGYLKWAFRIPAAWAFIGFFAIPAVQDAVSGAYVDVPAAAAFTVLMFSICDLWANPAKFRHPARWTVMFLAAFIAANFKPQTTVFVCLAMPLVLPPSWRLLRERLASRLEWFGAGLLMAGAWLLIAYKPIENLFVYGNPLYPVELKIGPLHLPGPASQDAWLTVGRVYQNNPQWLQWLRSVLEFHALDGRAIPYSNGMGGVPDNLPSASMGGFFSALVVASGVFFILGVWRNRDRLSYTLLGVFIYFTLITAFAPNTSNLRYVLFWMMFLVAACLLLFQRLDLKAYLDSYKIVLFAALIFVTSVTGGTYFKPVRLSMQTYADHVGASRALERVGINAGDVICLEQSSELANRYTILFAPIFHKDLPPYGIREDDCQGYKTIKSLE